MRNVFNFKQISALLVLLLVLALAAPIVTLAASKPQAPATFEVQPLPPSALQVPPSILPTQKNKQPKIDSVLVELAQAALLSTPAAAELAASRDLRLSNAGVQIQVTPVSGQLQEAITAVQFLGGEITGRSNDGQLLQGWLPPQALLQLANEKSVAYIQQAVKAELLEESLVIDVTSEGLAVMNGPAWHAAGLRGSGVKVAIVDGGFLGYPDLLGAELPASVTAKNFVDGESDLQVNGTSPHGTGCAEIVYDIAPQASMYLVKIATNIDLEEAVNWLNYSGCRRDFYFAGLV